MTTVTGMTADRMLAIEAASVVDGDVVGGDLILTKHDGSQIDAGSVIGPAGPAGPIGKDVAVVMATPVLDVGLVGQIRAGRQLVVSDFTSIGLSPPLGLWNLSGLTDASGNGRGLSNKGSVTFTNGINGAASTAARFIGSTSQGLYISDIGSADPFRIRTGSVGCWFRTNNVGVQQTLISKRGANGSTQKGYFMDVSTNGNAYCGITFDGTNWSALANGTSVVVDDRWHFVVFTFDGVILRFYTDGTLEGTIQLPGVFFPTVAPVNIGAFAADGSNAGQDPHFGAIDEAFITADVLSEDQIRNLYCAKLTHTLAAIPSRVSLNVHRRRKGAAVTVGDFPTVPLRLYNFSGGSLGDEGSNGTGLVNNGTAVSVSGVDGSAGNAFNFAGAQSLSATDANLPLTTASRSAGCWVKTQKTGLQGFIAWGSGSAAASGVWLGTGSAGTIASQSGGDVIYGPYIADGLWHFITMTEDNGASDGIKRKLYFDGALVNDSLALASIASGGANRFRIGACSDGTGFVSGLIDGAFVCDYALTTDQVRTLYIKSLMALTSSPKNAGDHIEGMNASTLLAVFDTLDPQHTVDLMVAP